MKYKNYNNKVLKKGENEGNWNQALLDIFKTGILSISVHFYTGLCSMEK